MVVYQELEVLLKKIANLHNSNYDCKQNVSIVENFSKFNLATNIMVNSAKIGPIKYK